MKYYGIMPEHKRWVRFAVAFIGAYILFKAFTEPNHWYYFPVGILVILCAFFWKQYIVDENGVDVRSNMVGIIGHNLWKWEDITSLHTDYEAAAPNVQCHFGRDVVTRTFVFSYDDSQAILKLAEEMNPDMYIDDMNEERRAELAENARKYREKQAAEKAKKRAAKQARKKK